MSNNNSETNLTQALLDLKNSWVVVSFPFYLFFKQSVIVLNTHAHNENDLEIYLLVDNSPRKNLTLVIIEWGNFHDTNKDYLQAWNTNYPTMIAHKMVIYNTSTPSLIILLVHWGDDDWSNHCSISETCLQLVTHRHVTSLILLIYLKDRVNIRLFTSDSDHLMTGVDGRLNLKFTECEWIKRCLEFLFDCLGSTSCYSRILLNMLPTNSFLFKLIKTSLQFCGVITN